MDKRASVLLLATTAIALSATQIGVSGSSSLTFDQHGRLEGLGDLHEPIEGGDPPISNPYCSLS